MRKSADKGHEAVSVGFRRMLGELYREDKHEIMREMEAMGIDWETQEIVRTPSRGSMGSRARARGAAPEHGTPHRTPSKSWARELTFEEAASMTVEELDEFHRKLQVQSAIDFPEVVSLKQFRNNPSSRC